MKILFISEYFPPKIMGGGEINLNLIAKSLVKEGVDVTVLTSHHEGLKKYEEKDKIKIYRTLKTGDNPHTLLNNLKRSFLYPRSVIKETRKITERHKFDAVHLIGSSLIAGKQLRNLPLFATIESYPSLCPKGDRIFHGKRECKTVCSGTKFLRCQARSKEIGKMKNKPYLKYNPLFLFFIYHHYKKFNNSLRYCQLISISRYVRKVLLQHKHLSHVVPNIINVKDFKREGTKSKETRILYLGSLIESKGPQVLLNALKGLKNYRCDLYGEGPLKDNLKKIINKHDLNARIHPPVSYKEIPKIYANSEIVVFPSIWPEPFGRIAVEGLAAGKIVIGSEIGGIKETLKGKGILVEPGDAEGLREALKKKIKVKATNQDGYSIKKISKLLFSIYRINFT